VASPPGEQSTNCASLNFEFEVYRSCNITKPLRRGRAQSDIGLIFFNGF